MLIQIALVIITDIAITVALAFRFKKPPFIKLAAVFVASIAVFVPAAFFSINYTTFLVHNIFAYSCLAVIFMVLFKQTIFKSIISVALAVLPMYLLSACAWLVFTRGFKSSELGIFSYPMASWGFTLVLACIYFAIYFMAPLKKIFVTMDKYDVIFSFIFTNFVLYIISYSDTIIYAIEGGDHANLQILLISVSVFINLTLVLSYIDRAKKESKMTEYEQLRHKITPFIENSLRIQHDYKNHLNVIKTYIDDENQNIIQLVDRASKYIDRHNEHLKWKNPLFSALINRKSSEAYNDSISFTTISHGVDDLLPLDDYSLIVVVANLIDNAFEATRKLKTNERKVSLTIGKDKDYYIEIANTAEINFKVMKNMFRKGFSTKGSGHGLGLHSVSKIVKKTKGKISVYPDDHSITIKIAFPVAVKRKRILMQRSEKA